MSAERREKLVELVNEYLSCEVTDSSALVLELKDALQIVIDYHQGNVDKAKEMLEYIEGKRAVPWVHPDSGIERVKRQEREYNLKEINYYNKRVRLDAVSEGTKEDWEDFWNNEMLEDPPPFPQRY